VSTTLRSVEVYRSLPRYAATRLIATKLPGVSSTPAAPLRLVRGKGPQLPARGGAASARACPASAAPTCRR
jgi:hypothetical protein